MWFENWFELRGGKDICPRLKLDLDIAMAFFFFFNVFCRKYQVTIS